ncbi:glycine--tRNA ligase 2 [Carex littledalei]|uniref:glycine--tRNA ligase n=1 Tax=Carex littledalei TaxID=544730 RepID=A0A833RBV1_9POAL|nr:glycine--tRNA ligase 2 [Carex littledalei]
MALYHPFPFTGATITSPRQAILSRPFFSPFRQAYAVRRRIARAAGDGGGAASPSSSSVEASGISPQAKLLDGHGEGSSALTFQQAIQRLQEYWASVGCAIMQCSNTEVGAGTMNPLTFLRVLGPEPWNVAYVEPSIRPDDSRYGDNPNRLQRHTQFQVILKPDPGNSQDLFLHSLSALGININEHDIRFVEDNWESPVLGAWGLGWEVWMDGMEITQFTYFQQAGSLQLAPISVEITYGLERILILLQGVNHFKKIQYADGITYGELFLENEKEMSAYYLEHANVDDIQKHFDNFEKEALSLLSLGLPIPAYDQVLKASHVFNILDSRGFVGVTERARYFGRMRSLARHCAQLWVKTRTDLGHPLGTAPFDLNDHVVSGLGDTNLSKVMDQSRLFVLEIGTEELPPNDVVEASKQLKASILKMLKKRILNHGEVHAFGTPRRLVICVDDLDPKQTEVVIEVRGPPVSKAFDSEGKPTKAAEGFCRKNSISIKSLFKKTEGKTEYIYAQVKQSARSAIEVLAEDLPSIISGIYFPKSMRWNSQILFSRPVRWILALHGDLVVPFCFAGVSSGKQSCGLRNSSLATIQVETAENYLDGIKNTGILIDIQKRKEKILQQSTSLAESVGGVLNIADSLMQEVVNLVEAPLPILGTFDNSFLELPKEILTTVMHKHQKYFHLTCASSGNLLPFFIAVANGVVKEEIVRKGNEAVLRARYEDARFFYKMDTQKKFSEFRPHLNGILFHEKLGTMLDKTVRIEETVPGLAKALQIEQNKMPILEKSASYVMSDLSSAVVTEFTSLAGIMARHYALRDGLTEEVAEALFEINLPRFSGDILPKSDAGIVLAVADRLDSLVGLFGAGCEPSSTSDPFGLRRISYGLVQILVENNKRLDLRNALQLVADVQPIEIDDSVIDNVLQFVARRLEQLLVDKGITSEIVRSVLLERSNCPFLASQSATEMEALSRKENFAKVVEAYSRPTRIIRGKDVSSDLEEDEKIRNNRLALLKKIAGLPKGVADLSVLPGF